MLSPTSCCAPTCRGPRRGTATATRCCCPATIDDFYEINDYTKRISGLYFTTITRDKAYVRDLLTGAERSWFPLLEGRIPSDFPLTQGFPLNNMDQLFLTDRVRWNK